MSGTEDFGTGGYGAGDAERAAAEAAPGGSARNAPPPTGPRVHVPAGPNQGAAGGGGGANGAPWLAAGSVPYAEAMFGGSGQDGPQGPGGPAGAARGAVPGRVPRGASAGGRRGIPDAPMQQAQPGGSGYPEDPSYSDGYGPEYGADGYGPDGYANGYAPQSAQPQVPQLPGQRYDARPFDSGFTQQGRFTGQQQPGGYDQPTAQQPGPGFEPAPGFEQGPYQGQGQSQGRPYPSAGAAQRPGFDEPTTEFLPGPLFDEPTVRPASPPPGPPPAAGGSLNGRGALFNARQSPQSQGLPNGIAPGQPPGTTQRPSMSGSGTWTAAPPPAAQQTPQAGPQQPAPGQNPLGQSGLGHTAAGPGPAGGGQAAGGQLSSSQSSASVSGIPRVPSQQAAAVAQSAQSAAAPPAAPAPPLASASAGQVGAARGEPPRRADSGYSSAPLPSRPPLPDEPPPGPPPLPVRPPRAERQAAQQAQAQAQAQAHAQAQAAPSQAGAVQQQNPPHQNPSAVQSAAASAAAAVRETLTPPRRIPQPQPSVAGQPAAEQLRTPSTSAPQQAGQIPHVQGRTVEHQSADDLTSERLRSVAPSVPAPRTATPEPQTAHTAAAATAAPAPAPTVAAPPVAAQRPGRSGSFDSLAEPAPSGPHENDADEGDELIVPWQAAQPSAEPLDDEDEDDDVLHGTGQRPIATTPQPQQPVDQQDQTPITPPRQQQPQPQQPPAPEHVPAAPVAATVPQQQASQGAQATAPTRTEATAAQQHPAPPVPTAQQPAAPQPAVQQQPPQQPAVQQPQVPAQQPLPAAQPAPAPATSAAVPDAAVASAPDDAPSTVPAPRGTRRRLPEPDTEPDSRLYASTAAPVADASAAPGPQQPPQVLTPDAAEPAEFPTAPQPHLHPDLAAPPSADASDSRAPAYDDEALAAVYRVIHERRDVRNDFLHDAVPTEVLTRILEAAHTAPSVGFSQPWDFLVIRDQATRQRVHELAVRQRRAYAASLPKARARAFAALKIEAILDTPVNIVVTCDPTRGGRHTLGRYTQPLMAPFSSCLAVENLWLASRAEGLGVGWVSFFDERELAAVLDLPDHLQIVAYLCVGYVKSFPPEPELAGAGWAQRRPLAWAVHEERFGHRALPGSEPISLLSETVAAIRGLDPEALSAARDRQARMTKPPGSLGALEALCEQLSGLAGVCPPPLPEPAALAVFAADHGVHAQGVTPWPQEVTAQMVANFLAGGAVVNAFAKQVGAEVCVVDVGVNADLAASVGLIPRKIRYGTADMTQGPALTREEATAALEAGIETARDLVAAGNRCLLTGDMGIANTTASAALIAAFTGASPAQVTGYGTGIDEQTYAHKVEVVRTALELHRPDPQDPVGVLCAFGGLEHAALAGFILGAAALRVPVVLDGVIAGAAALVAQALSPEVTAACVAGHRSAEPGHALALEQLGITPLIDLELRLGEGSGAALALPLVGAAVRALREVATFDSAGVSDASSASVAPPTERERA